MNLRCWWPASCAALLCFAACQDEVTLYLSRGPLSNEAGASDASTAVPVGIALGNTAPTAVTSGASTGGVAYNQTCESNLVLMGINGTADSPDSGESNPATVQGVCGQVSIQGSGPFQVATTQTAMLDLRGLTLGSVTQNRMCPDGQVVVGFDWRAGEYVDQLVLRCAPLTISSGAAGFTLSIGIATSLDPIGGDGGTTTGETSCAEGQVAVGYAGRSGAVIDAFGLLCATPSLAR